MTTKAKSPDKAKAFLDFLKHAGGAEDLRVQGLPERAAELVDKSKYPTPEGPVHDRPSSAAGTRSTPCSSTRTAAPWRRSNRIWVSAPPSDARVIAERGAGHCGRRPVALQATGRAPRRRRRALGPAGDRRGLRRVAHADRADPARGGRRALVPGRDRGLRRRGHQPPGGRRVRFTLIVSIVVAAIDAVMGVLIAWVLYLALNEIESRALWSYRSHSFKALQPKGAGCTQ